MRKGNFAVHNFLHILLVLMLISLAAPAIATTSPAVDSNAPPNKFCTSTVTIRVYDAQQHLLRSGCGYYVELAQLQGDPVRGVMTCRHLFAGAVSAEAETSDGQRIPLREVLAEEARYNIVLLAAELPPAMLPLIPTGDYPYSAQKSVWLLMPGHATQQGTLTTSDNTEFALFNYHLAPEQCGCPVIDTAGKLLGMAFSSLPSHKTANTLVVPATSFQVLPAVNARPLAAWATTMPSPWPTSKEGLTWQSYEWLAVYDFSSASRCLDRLEKLARGSAQLQLARGECLLDENKNSQAEKILQTVCSRMPDSADAHFDLGTILIRQADNTLSSLPGQPRSAITTVLTALGNRADGLAECQEGCRLDPMDYQVALDLMNNLAMFHRTDAVLDVCRRELRYHPNSVYMRIIAGAAELGLQQTKRRCLTCNRPYNSTRLTRSDKQFSGSRILSSSVMRRPSPRCRRPSA